MQVGKNKTLHTKKMFSYIHIVQHKTIKQNIIETEKKMIDRKKLSFLNLVL